MMICIATTFDVGKRNFGRREQCRRCDSFKTSSTIILQRKTNIFWQLEKRRISRKLPSAPLPKWPKSRKTLKQRQPGDLVTNDDGLNNLRVTPKINDDDVDFDDERAWRASGRMFIATSTEIVHNNQTKQTRPLAHQRHAPTSERKWSRKNLYKAVLSEQPWAF